MGEDLLMLGVGVKVPLEVGVGALGAGAAVGGGVGDFWGMSLVCLVSSIVLKVGPTFLVGGGGAADSISLVILSSCLRVLSMSCWIWVAAGGAAVWVVWVGRGFGLAVLVWGVVLVATEPGWLGVVEPGSGFGDWLTIVTLVMLMTEGWIGAGLVVGCV